MHHNENSLVVVEVIDQNNVMPLELKDHPPIAAHVYSLEAGILAFQPMQAQPRQVHILRFRCNVKTRQNEPQSVGVLRLYSSFFARLEEIFQALVPEAYDHMKKINCNPLGGKRIM